MIAARFLGDDGPHAIFVELDNGRTKRIVRVPIGPKPRREWRFGLALIAAISLSAALWLSVAYLAWWGAR